MSRIHFTTLLVVLALAGIVLCAGPALAADQEMKGKIKKIEPDQNRFILTDPQNKDHTFALSKETKVRVADRDGKLADLKVGDQVTVRYEEKGGKNIVSSLERK